MLADQKHVKKLPLMECFGPTIQGEGYMVGVRTTFLRFGLCDYKCKMCDSMHAVDPQKVKENAEWLTPYEISDKLYKVLTSNDTETKNCDWVTFSGGNPCIHDLTELVYRIRGFDILIGKINIAVETQGTFAPDWLHLCDVVTCSPKSPGMGEKFEHDKFVDFVLKFQYHKGFNVKVVIFSMQDIEFLKSINEIVLGVNPDLKDRIYASLGNSWPPGFDVSMNSDDELKLSLLKDFKVLTEDLLQVNELSNVKFMPQLHVLTWANLQGV